MPFVFHRNARLFYQYDTLGTTKPWNARSIVFFVIGDHEEFPVTKDFVEGNEKYQDWRQIPLLVRGLAFCFAKQGGIVL